MNKVTKTLIGVVVVAVIGGLIASQQPEISIVSPPTAGQFSQQQLARGEKLAALGDCAVCHTRAGGETNSGGLGLESPFGTIYSSNITPDVSSGIGAWSYEAFARAMRHGVDRHGDYLYPAFPYTSFTATRDEDLQALYAWLMSQPPVHYQPPATALNFPFNIRQGMAVWNWLFLKPGPRADDPQRSAEWNRGAYLAESLGHCSACHSPRNLFFAEKSGNDHLGGGIAEGWIAPALNSHSPAPVTWDREQLLTYLRTGYSTVHGPATGPMAPVIAEGLSQQSEEDLQAIATWLSSFHSLEAGSANAGALVNRAEQNTARLTSAGARQFAGSCMACHSQNNGPQLTGVRPALVLNSNLYSDSPDNLIHVVLDGIQRPATPALGTMPGFRHQLNDQQIAVLLNYLRSDIASQTAWPDLEAKVAEIRQQSTEQP